MNGNKMADVVGAMEIIQRHYADKPNKMEVVAALFGKKLGEEFRVKSCHPEGNCVGYFSKYGFEGYNQTATANVAALLLLLTGKAVIVDE